MDARDLRSAGGYNADPMKEKNGKKSRKDKPLLVTINTQVKFYIKGQDMYLLDEAGDG
jgi:hypothetical protein